MVDVANLKKLACDAIDAAAGPLHEVSQDIWEHPELNFEERHAHKVLCDFLSGQGLAVTPHYLLETAFKAEYGSGGEGKPRVCVVAEYDALPEIGHACGHNLIAEAAVGAGVGIRAALKAAQEAGVNLGQLAVLGTPAEEGGGGKIDLIDAGAFKNYDISMMCHPAPFNDTVKKLNYALSIAQVTVRYKGKASHAAGAPWAGVNALDAAVMAYQALSNMRQQMKPTWRVHGIISDGGAKPNIIPETSCLEYYLRAPTVAELKVLKERAAGCFQAAATATGCQVEIDWLPKPYADMITNTPLVELYEANAEALGVSFDDELVKKDMPSGSTDMGNVSYVVPSIHPMFYIGTRAFNHTREFTVATGKDEAQPYTVTQAKAMACTAIDVLAKPELVKTITESFRKDLVERNA